MADDLAVGLDVDGVLSRLGERLAVAVVSGRSLENLKRQFAFPEVVEVIGSYGLEWRSGSQVVLDDAQRALLDQVTALADQAEPARAKAALDSLRNRHADVLPSPRRDAYGVRGRRSHRRRGVPCGGSP